MPGLPAWNVLKIAPTSFFADYGCHVRIYEETRALQRLGHRVTIVTYQSGEDLPGIDIRRSPGLPWRRRVRVGSSPGRIYHDAKLALRALQVALQVRPTIIHAHLHEGALIGAAISRLLRVPLVFDFQGSLTSEMLDHNFLKVSSPLYGVFRAVETIITRFPHGILTSSRNAADLLVREFGVPASRVATVADAVDPTFFRSKWARAEPANLAKLRLDLNIPAGRPVVVYLGLLAEYQGTSKLLEAAAELARRGIDAHFLIMGYPGVDTYQRIAADLGISDRTTFTGRVPYRRAPEMLLLGDVAVSPKMSETEGNGKLLNYEAVGLPTVAFDTPVAKEILGEDGVYADFGKAVSLADRIQDLLADPDLRERIGRRLRERVVSTQSWDKSIEQVLAVYQATSKRRPVS